MRYKAIIFITTFFLLSVLVYASIEVGYNDESIPVVNIGLTSDSLQIDTNMYLNIESSFYNNFTWRITQSCDSPYILVTEPKRIFIIDQKSYDITDC